MHATGSGHADTAFHVVDRLNDVIPLCLITFGRFGTFYNWLPQSAKGSLKNLIPSFTYVLFLLWPLLISLFLHYLDVLSFLISYSHPVYSAPEYLISTVDLIRYENGDFRKRSSWEEFENASLAF